jgi:nicotinate phosphoribosyltransferase
MDVLCLKEENISSGARVYDPTNPLRNKTIPEGVTLEEMRQVVMEGGRIVMESPPLEEMADRALAQLQRLPEGSLRLFNPHRYKVAMSQGLHDLRSRLMEEIRTTD